MRGDNGGVHDHGLTQQQIDSVLSTDERAAVGEKGELIESCLPLQLPSEIGEQFIRQFVTRCFCASYREPHVFSAFVVNSATLLKILRKATLVFSDEPNVVDVIVPESGSTHVIGDTHGDIHSFMSLLFRTGLPSDSNRLVFSGDYVDRGPWGVEIIIIVSLLKIWQPKNVFILRGNHETTGCIQRYGFEDEVKYKFSSKMVSSFVSLFRALPIVAVIRTLASTISDSSNDVDTGKKHSKQKRKVLKRNVKKPAANTSSSSQFPWSGPATPGERRVMVMHGGLFRSEQARKENRNEIGRLTELVEFNRNIADPYGNAVEDVLWSDPQLSHNGVADNNFRGCGILFGPTVVEYFFQHNSIHGIIRAHEGPDMRERRPDMPDMQNGFSVDMELGSGFVATVFSSANYSYQEPKANKAAFATLFGKKHPDAQATVSIPRFTTYEKFSPPSEEDVHLFYTGDGPCCTPRESFS